MENNQPSAEAFEQQMQMQMEMQQRMQMAQQKRAQVHSWSTQLEDLRAQRMRRSQVYADTYIQLFITLAQNYSGSPTTLHNSPTPLPDFPIEDLTPAAPLSPSEAITKAKEFCELVRTVADSYETTLMSEAPEARDLDHLENVLKRYISAAEAELKAEKH
jgi:hypothetical protein